MYARRYMAKDLAALFGKSPAWVSVNIGRLMERDGFPKPVRGTRSRWDADKVDQWFEESPLLGQPSRPETREAAPVAAPLIERGAFRAAFGRSA